MRKVFLSILLLALIVLSSGFFFVTVLSGANREGLQDDHGNYIECYRIFLSESTQTIEGRAIQVPQRSTRRAIWILQTEDGVATIRAGSKYVDAYEKIDCGVLNSSREGS